MASEPQSVQDRTPNRLVDETSPYLLQHAYNPIDWYPWGEEAFEAARLQDKPIFLSIGYSTCYWCHVMERESFENIKVAEFMNEHFINIKMDREERPDIDDVYMTAVQLMTGSGGWPMSIFMEPDTLKPFFGGTYFPPDDRSGRPGFLTVGARLSDAWKNQRDMVQAQADKIADAIIEQLSIRPAAVPVGREEVDTAVSQLMSMYDPTHAGYSSGPNKFPMPVTLDLLMEAAWDNTDVRASVLHTLDRMATGGMYDQIGGGFHRYSTDVEWLVPHFEKMLYDNAMLASVYARACRLTGNQFYCEIARETVEYVLRELSAKNGAYLSAQDAESNAIEGESYIWTPEQVREVLAEGGMDPVEIELVIRAYGLDLGPNFQDPHHPGPKNVIHLIDRPDRLAVALEVTEADLSSMLLQANEILLRHRDLRDQPITDDKIIAGWNGLMISGMADTGRLLEEDRYISSAVNAADFIRSSMWSDEGGLLRTSRNGQAKIAAFLEDYAMLVRGLISVYESTRDSQWLEFAQRLVDQARERFWDVESGGWFDTQADQSDLFVRGRGLYDGAVPSGSGSMLLNLVRLKAIYEDGRLDDDIRQALDSASVTMKRSPTSSAQSTQALARILRDHPDLVEAPAEQKAAMSGRVLMKVDPSVIEVSMKPVTVELVVEIEEGWHLASPEQKDPYTIGMSIGTLENNLEVTALWPDAHPFTGPEGDIDVYEGTIRIPVTLVAKGSIDPEASVMLTWQACNDKVCDRPMTERIPLRVVSAESP